MNTVILHTADGVSIALHHLTPDAPHRAPVVLLVHGFFTGHAVWLRGGVAGFLSARGLDVWLADWRHHGASSREPAPKTWHFADLIEHDAPAFVAAVREATGARPVWVGHSVGGVIGLALLAHDPSAEVAGCVALGTPGPLIGPARRMLARATISISRALGRFPARRLGMGSEDEAALIVAEWMEWNLRGAWIGADGFDYFSGLDRVRTPFMGVAGAGDRWFAPAAACRMLADRVGAPRKSFAVFGPGVDHRGLLLDPRALQRGWPLIADWIARLPRTAALPARILP